MSMCIHICTYMKEGEQEKNNKKRFLQFKTNSELIMLHDFHHLIHLLLHKKWKLEELTELQVLMMYAVKCLSFISDIYFISFVHVTRSQERRDSILLISALISPVLQGKEDT